MDKNLWWCILLQFSQTSSGYKIILCNDCSTKWLTLTIHGFCWGVFTLYQFQELHQVHSFYVYMNSWDQLPTFLIHPFLPLFDLPDQLCLSKDDWELIQLNMTIHKVELWMEKKYARIKLFLSLKTPIEWMAKFRYTRVKCDQIEKKNYTQIWDKRQRWFNFKYH